jgi:hypothetical protein
MKKSFNREELFVFWATHFPNFYDDYEGTDLPKGKLITLFLHYARRRGRIANLHELLRELRPEAYKRYFSHRYWLSS